jgi:hypothetical protein
MTTLRGGLVVAVLSVLDGRVALGQDTRSATPVTRSTDDAPAKTPLATLLTVGATSLGLAYGASIVTAAASTRPLDHWLYVPLVGPYMNLAGRETCEGASARPCYREAANKLLLATDGILQTVGTAAIIFAVVKPTRARTASERPAVVQLGLVQLRRGQPGLAAFGHF